MSRSLLLRFGTERFLPLSARDGPRFAAGFARRGCGLPSFDIFLRVSGAIAEI